MNEIKGKDAVERMKLEIARELNIPLTNDYRDSLTRKQAGAIGGEMTKRLVAIGKDTLKRLNY